MYCYSNCIVRYSIPEFNDGISLIWYMYVLQTIIYIRGFEVFYLLIGKNNSFYFMQDLQYKFPEHIRYLFI
jgi:hypothetical protein